MARKLRCGGDVESSLVHINSRDDDFSFLIQNCLLARYQMAVQYRSQIELVF